MSILTQIVRRRMTLVPEVVLAEVDDLIALAVAVGAMDVPSALSVAVAMMTVPSTQSVA